MLSHKRFFGYGMTGGMAALIDLGLFLLFESMGMALLLAATASFLIAAVFNFTSSSLFVFRTALSWSRFARFVSVATIGLTINVGITWLVYQVVPVPVVAKTIGIGLAFLFNFVAHSFLVFGSPANKDKRPG